MAWFQRKTELVQIEANLTWEVFRDPKTGRFIGVCRALNVNAVGDTWGEFQEAANETLQMLLAVLHKEGKLDAFLRRKGWSVMGRPPTPGTTPRFEVPFSLERKKRAEELVTT
jgi:hypothetical protein